jgi:glucose/mannose-6-phosphate isomerase
MTEPAKFLDSANLFDSVLAFPKQCSQVIWEMAQEQIPNQCYLSTNIVVSGMGGSALGGRVIASLERQVLRVPVVVSTEYHLPNFVNKNSLVVISSYSGNTEETISSLAESQARDAQVFIITTGGKLAQLARDQKLPHYVFDPKHNPSAQPRMGLGYAVLSLVSLLARCQLIHPVAKLGQLPDYLAGKQANSPKYAELAKDLKGKIPILVTSEHLKGAAHCFKNQLNENSKNFSALFDIPELNHHLMEGLSFPKTNPSNLHFVFFTSKHFHPEAAKRYPITQTVLKKQGISFSQIDLEGPSRLFEVMELIQMGGFVSFYLSQENNIDPGPIPWVDFFKDSL